MYNIIKIEERRKVNEGFEILSHNTVVAVWKDNELKVLNNDLLPLYLKRANDAKSWFETKAIDSHRANSRLLKKALRLTITLFNELTEKHHEYKEYLSKLTEQMIKKVISKINMKVKSQAIVDIVIKRYQAIK